MPANTVFIVADDAMHSARSCGTAELFVETQGMRCMSSESRATVAKRRDTPCVPATTRLSSKFRAWRRSSDCARIEGKNRKVTQSQ